MVKIGVLNEIPNRVRLSANHLLYKIDIELCCVVEGDQVFFNGKGSVKIGPKRSVFSASSKYRVNENNLVFINQEIMIQGFNINEQYCREEFVKNEVQLIDPLFVFFLFFLEELKIKKYQIFLAKKIREVKVDLLSEEKGVFYKNKKDIHLEKKERDFLLKVKKIGLKFKLSRLD